MKRYAIVTNARTRREAEAYLPGNYSIVWEGRVPAYEGAAPERTADGFVIKGEDSHGWTLDGYVIPRYASGLIGCKEIDLSHPIMKQVPVEPRAAKALRGQDYITDDDGTNPRDVYTGEPLDL